jgi:hypothetical protein
MESDSLMTFKSHVNGKNVDVAIYVDRIEWGQAGAVSLTRLAAGTMTVGVSLLKTGIRKSGASEMMPTKSISSVTMAKDTCAFIKWSSSAPETQSSSVSTKQMVNPRRPCSHS